MIGFREKVLKIFFLWSPQRLPGPTACTYNRCNHYFIIIFVKPGMSYVNLDSSLDMINIDR